MHRRTRSALVAGLAVSPDGTRVFVAGQDAGDVTVVDTRTRTTIGDPIPVGDFPSAVLVSGDGRRVYVASQNSNDVRIVDARTRKVVGRPIPTGEAPDGLAANADGSRIYVTNMYSNDVTVIDTSTLLPVRSDSFAATPRGIAVARI